MSRAEKFIQDYTRNYSNKIWSPYPQINNDVRKIDGEPAKEFSPWLTPDQARKAVEIAREEMIEKAVLYVIYKTRTVHYNNYNTREFNKSSLYDIINDLKQAMKEE